MANFSYHYSEISDEDSSEMVLASKNGHWDTVWTILDKKPYLVNSIPKERAWSVLHQAVWWQNSNAVKKILNIPGCDSELLTKNGLRPLDIETIPEIKQILKDHIESSEASKVSFFLTPDDLAVPPDGIENPDNLTDEELEAAELPMLEEISKASATRDWKRLFRILNFWKHLINMINPKTGLAPIHEAALAGDEKVITELMSYTACNPNVKTEIPAIVGPGKTAAEIATNENIKKAIKWKLKDQKEKYNNEIPSCVEIQSGHLNIMWYVSGAIKKYKICEDNFNPDYSKSFPDMEKHISKYMNEGENWKYVRDIVAKTFPKIYDVDKKEILKAQTKEKFFETMIKIYTGGYYSSLNKCLREHPSALPKASTEDTTYRLYTAITNAILFHESLPNVDNTYTNTTYRIMNLPIEAIAQYQNVGYTFCWLSFTSSSTNKTPPFSGNCKFIFNNDTKCPWSPKGIEKVSFYPHEEEYLYPCGAQFQVTKFEINGFTNEIHLKLIHSPVAIKFTQLIYDKNKSFFETLVGKYRETYTPVIVKQKQLVDEESKKLHALHLEKKRLENFTTEVAEKKTTDVKLPKGQHAYHCRDCNTTCDYPCPEEHMFLGRCEFCIPRAEGACSKCQGGCHFGRHHRVTYKTEVEFSLKTVVDRDMRAKHAIAVAKYDAQNLCCSNMNTKYTNSIAKLPKATNLVGNMQKSIQGLEEILSVTYPDAWESYDGAVKQLGECKQTLEECRFEMSGMGFL